jgi:ceramide glucosyltransferase
MFFDLALVFLCIAVFSQFLYFLLITSNHKDFVKRYNRDFKEFRPKVLLTVPCKGLDMGFSRNILSLMRLDYENYNIHFVVESESDPAYESLQRIIDRCGDDMPAGFAKVLVAGISKGYSQKNHNLLHSIKLAPEDTEIYAFADSDTRVSRLWLAHLIYPLKSSKTGVSTGYRYFIPARRRLSNLALSSMNAAAAQIMGKSKYTTQVWGGSMAIRKELFEQLGVAELWQKSISDDLTLSAAVRSAGYKIRLMPRCFTVTFEDMSWGQLFEFGRRQMLITRVAYLRMWLWGLFCLLNHFIGVWVLPVVAAVRFAMGANDAKLFAAAAVIHWASLIFRTYMRRRTFGFVLGAYCSYVRQLSIWEFLLNPLWLALMTALMVISSFGRTICWRGVRYRLNGPFDIERLG